MAERGNPNWKKQTDENGVELTKEQIYEKKIKELEEQLASKQKIDDFVIIPEEAKLELRTNVSGKFILREDRGKANIFIPFAGYRSTARISFGELRLVFGAKPDFFTKGKLAITRIYCENKSITLEDVYRDMGLENLYLEKDRVNPVNIETIFSDKITEREFEQLVNNSRDMSEVILEVANVLYRKGTFHNSTKQAYLKAVYHNQNLFR